MKIKQLEKELAERVKNLDNMLEKCKKDCPVVYDIFNSSGMVFYRLFKMHDSFENVEHIVYALHHAFVDDGEFYVVKELNEPATRSRNNLSKITGKEYDTVYDYKLVEWHGSGMPVNQNQLHSILSAHNRAYKFEKNNCQKLNQSTIINGVYNSANRIDLNELRLLDYIAINSFEQVYQENNR